MLHFFIDGNLLQCEQTFLDIRKVSLVILNYDRCGVARVKSVVFSLPKLKAY